MHGAVAARERSGDLPLVAAVHAAGVARGAGACGTVVHCRAAAAGGGGALEGLHLRLEELDVVDGLVQHGRRVHLGAARDEPLQDADALADALPPHPRRHALRVGGDAHVAPLRGPNHLRVDVHGLQRRHAEDHLPHRRRPDGGGAAAALPAAVVAPAAAGGMVVLLRMRHVLRVRPPGAAVARRHISCDDLGVLVVVVVVDAAAAATAAVVGARRHVMRHRREMVMMTSCLLHARRRRGTRRHHHHGAVVVGERERRELLQLEHCVHQLQLRLRVGIQHVEVHSGP